MSSLEKLLNKKIIILVILLLLALSILTSYVGGNDVHDYADVAKFFAGEYSAKIRTSHSLLYGFIHAPLVSLFNSFLVMKITSVLWISLIILSVYYISNKDKRALLLILASPIVWFMGPWINPIQLAGLLFLWSFYFINKFDRTEKKIYLIYAGLLAGLSWAFWNTVIFILFFLIVVFFYNRNVNNLVIFIFFIFIGLSPLLILDQVLFGLPFYSIIRHFIGVVVTSLYGSIYPGVNQVTNSIANYIGFIIMLPFFGYTLFSRKFFKKNKKEIIFLMLVLLFFLLNPQIRYIIFFWPILMLYLPRALNEKQFKIQLTIFVIISLVVINPYIIQTKYSTNSPDLTFLVSNFGKWTISDINRDRLMEEDLKNIIKANPDTIFVVGNEPDNYALLAFLYWGSEVEEFVSIQDYNLYLNNESNLFSRTIKSQPRIEDRRQIWISGGLQKNENDATDYESITYGISIGEPINLEGFELIEAYDVLHLSKKTS